MSTVDIGRDAARDAAQHELAKPIYPKPSLTERITGWLDELLYRILAEGSSVPGGWLTVTVLALLLAAAAVLAVRIAMRTSRSRRDAGTALFAPGEMTAAQHRAIAQGHADRREWAAAIRHRLRAVARQLEETGVVTPVPGRTATELSRDAGAALPALSDEMRRAAVTFNDVTYGEQPGTEAGYRQITDLDDHLRSRTAASDAVGGGTDSDAEWAQVR